jgi:single-strand DNA-binding protein
MSYAKLIIVGNLGADPELEYTKKGIAVTRLSVAVNEKHNDEKTTTWFRVGVFDKKAESAAQYLHKGSKVLAECSNVRPSPYLRKDGTPDASLEATAIRVVFLDSLEDDSDESSNGKVAQEEEADIPN